MFAISHSLLACHFYSTLTTFVYFYPTFVVFSVLLECFFYLVVFPLNAVHLTFQGHHRYSDEEECWTPEWVCVLLSSVYCILSWSFYSSSYLTICVYVPTLQISELLKLLIVVYMLFLPIFCLTHWHFPTTAEGFFVWFRIYKDEAAVRKEFLFLRMSTKHFINPMFHFCALLDVVVSQMLIFPKILEQCFNLTSSHIPFYLESVFLSGPLWLLPDCSSGLKYLLYITPASGFIDALGSFIISPHTCLI